MSRASLTNPLESIDDKRYRHAFADLPLAYLFNAAGLSY
ncbi:hypothetical protein HACA111877_15580 [Halomonas casei]